jgi:transcriptional regulator with XRE-family HTH domain
MRNELTQEETGVKAGISISYITLLETGRRKKPGWKTVASLAKVFGLKGSERRAFIRSAGYSEDIIGQTTVDLSPPVLKKLSRFLTLPAGSPEGPAMLRESLSSLEAIAAEKGLPYRHRKAIKFARMITTGYFSSGKDIYPLKHQGKGGTKEREIQLADRVREVIEIFVDGSIPIDKRIALAEELISYLKWKIEGEQR